jgi:hypothetical protein
MFVKSCLYTVLWNPHENNNDILHRHRKNLKFIWKQRRLWITKTILSKESNAENITIPDFKLYYRAKVTITSCYRHKNRCINQWNRLQDTKINPSIYRHLILEKGTKNIQWRKDHLFNKWWEKNCISTFRRLKLDPYLSPCIKNRLKMIKDFKYKTWNFETTRGNTSKGNISRYRHWQWLPEQDSNYPRKQKHELRNRIALK